MMKSVDIEADKTKTITTATTIAGSVDNIVGIIVSNKGLPVASLIAILSLYNLPNPPRNNSLLLQ